MNEKLETLESKMDTSFSGVNKRMDKLASNQDTLASNQAEMKKTLDSIDLRTGILVEFLQKNKIS